MQKIIVKRIEDVVIQGHGVDKSYRIAPPTISITVKGPSRVINNLKDDPDFDIYVDLKGLDSGVFVRRAIIMLPLNTTLIKATPELFTVHIDSSKKIGG